MLTGMIVIGGLMVLVGLGGAVLAWRRPVRLDDHPLCGRCGYDLSGRDANAGPCAECGADLRRAGGVRVGHTRARRGAIMAALGTLFTGIAIAGTGGALAAGAVDLTPYKPARLLRREALADRPAARGIALAELTRRLVGGALSQAQVDALTDGILARQADRTAAWDARWGNWVHVVDDAGRLDAARLARYAEQAVDVDIGVRPTLMRGDVLALSVGFPRQRASYEPRLYLDEIEWSVTIGGLPVARRDLALLHGSSISGSNVAGAAALAVRLRSIERRLAEGPAEVVVTMKGKAVRQSPGGIDHGAPVAAVAREVRLPVTITFDANVAAVAMDDRTELSDAMRRAIRPRQVRRGVGRGRWDMLIFDLDRPPADFAFSVIVTANGRSWPAGTLAHPAGIESFQEVGLDLRDLPAGVRTVDLELVPSAAVAREQSTLLKPFAGTLRYPNVSVLPPPPKDE